MLLPALLPALLITAQASANPWLKDPGHAYVKAGTVRFAAGQYVDSTGRTDSTATDQPEYVGTTNYVYAEVGLLPHIELVTNLPFVGSRNTLDDVAYVNRALGDAELGLATGTTLGQWPVALTVSAKLPMYDNADLNSYGGLGGHFPTIGDGQVDLTAIASVGRGFAIGRQPVWTALEAGYRHRTEWWLGDSTSPDRTILDGIPWHAQLGWSPTARDRDLGWLVADASGVQNFASNEYTKQWVQLGLGLAALVTHGFAIELGASTTPLATASSLGWAASAGVSWQH
ncbi:MAG: hypothetical protein GXP62_19585 [Oligoflexia bacterium]|nr:hypothetical protein [Oligoflexia bacterium]